MLYKKRPDFCRKTVPFYIFANNMTQSVYILF